jgi:glycosyltransferase involved in cell wall biosynthesis
MAKRTTQAPQARPLRKIAMYPLPSHAARDTTNSINQIVLKLQKYLPQFGYELTENPDEAVLIVGHAGQCGDQKYVDVAHSHGLYPTGGGQSEHWHWMANQGVIHSLRTAKEITVPSEWVGDIIRRDMNVEPHVIGWAVDPLEWQPQTQHGNYVLWNKTRADAVCDPTPMLELATKAPQQLFLTTFGQGTPNVKTIGRVPFEDMKRHVQNAQVYLATTRETWGIGTVEAMACGIPILGYKWGATADIVRHGIDGILVEPNDIQGLADGLAYCIKHRATLGANARKRALEFTWKQVAQRFAAVYDKALEPHKGVKVSVVIPCYNYGKWVGEAISSALAQKTSFEYEILIVDDESTDDSREVIDQSVKNWHDYHFAHFPNVSRVERLSKHNGGVAQARNYGIERASGEYIVALDADDKLGSPDFLQTLADVMDEDRTLGIAFTSLQVISETGELAPAISAWPDGWDFDKHVAGFNQVPTCCMFRKQAWARAGGYRTECIPAEDGNLWLRIGALGYRAEHVVKAGWFWYRDHANSLSKTRPQPNWRNFAWVENGQRPFASQGRAPMGSFPVRNYDTPQVSIIIPVGKGHGDILRRALDSVEAQTERDWECIVVSDGADMPVNAYTWAKFANTACAGSGAATARNIGLKMARGQLVTFLDADDYLHPRFLEKTMQAYRRSGRYIYTDWIALTKDGRTEMHQSENYDAQSIFRKASIHSINVLMRRKDALAVGGFDESMMTWEDPDFFMKLATIGVCGERLAEPLVAYDYRTGTLREKALTIQGQLKEMLYKRYMRYIEGMEAVCCQDRLIKAQTRMIQQNNELAAFAKSGNVHPQFGRMMLVEYRGAGAGKEVIGSVSGQRYQYREGGEIFSVWEVDVNNDPETFIPLAVEETIESTPMPQEPEMV